MNPDVVSVTRWPPRSETSRAKTRMPMRRAKGGRYEPLRSDEPRPDDEVGLAALDRPEELRELGRRRAGRLRRAARRRRSRSSSAYLKPGLHGAADADVEGEPQHGRSVRLGHVRRVVGRRVVDDDDVDRRDRRPGSRRRPGRSHRPRSTRARPRRAVARLIRATPDLEPDELEQPARAMRIGVLVENALARATAHLLGLARDPRRARGTRRPPPRRDSTTTSSRARLEPALDPLVRVRDDRRAGRRELERPRGRRAGNGRVRAARHVEVDARRRDRAREDVERDVAEQPRAAPVSPWKSSPPSAKSSSGASRDGSPTIVFIQSRRNLSP